MKKKILLTSYVNGNMNSLYDYYKKNTIKYSGNISVTLNIYKNKTKIQWFFCKLIEKISKYDIIISDYPTNLVNKPSEFIFMSHGYGTKLTPGNDEVLDEGKMLFYKKIRNKAKIITLSNREKKYYLRSEELDKLEEGKYIPLGLPRNDQLFNQNYIEDCNKEIERKFNIKNKKKILYCPTWRGYEVSGKYPLSRKDFEKLNEELEKIECVLVYRPHYIEKIFDDNLIVGLNNILNIGFDDELDTQKILAATDMLITDYSSIFIDFLALNRPIAFIPFDRKEYDIYRGLAINFEDRIDTPGRIISDINDFLTFLNEDDVFGKERKEAISRYYEYYDGNSCERVWNYILDNKGGI